jgi:hypothetical protein
MHKKMKKIPCLILFVGFYLVSFSQKKLGLTEYVTNTTIGIQANGKKLVSGTAFFFVFQTKNGSVPSLITSRHLLEDAQTVTLSFIESNFAGIPQYGKVQEITVNKTDLVVINHPDNDVDLAMIPVTSVLTYFLNKKITISYHPVNESAIPRDSLMRTLNPVENIYLIGYPGGIQKELSGIPFVKKGITATPVFLDFGKKKEFLVDVPSYEGSGGAPVFIYQNSNTDRNDQRMEGQRLLLVGVNSATFSKDFKERIYPDDPRNISRENTSVVIKAGRILEFKAVLDMIKN